MTRTAQQARKAAARRPVKQGRRPKLKPQFSERPSRPEVVRAVQLTNDEIRAAMFEANGNVAKAARRLGTTAVILRLILPNELNERPKADDVSVAEFDAACKAERDDRKRARQAKDAAGHEQAIGHDANVVTSAFPDDDNPDCHALKALRLLERRTPANWRVMVIAAAVELEQAMAAELKRIEGTRRKLEREARIEDAAMGDED